MKELNDNQEIFSQICQYELIEFYAEYNGAIKYASKNGHSDVVDILLKYRIVCQKLDKDWIKENLNETQINIYKTTLKNN